jgi:hypothetical protein
MPENAMSHLSAHTRRDVLACGAALALLPCSAAGATGGLPSEVAGIAIPRSVLAAKAAAYARASCPDYLFNHGLRTFLFGALSVKTLGLSYDEDEAFAAAALHDLGLLPAFESTRASFEIDGADAAEKFVLGQGMERAQADKVWHAIVFHDGRWPITMRQGPEAMLVSAGAGADVDGPGDDITAEQIAEIVAAFPRLEFKQKFTQLAVDHCRRKPLSQRGTWLEGLCREQQPDAFRETVQQEIARAPFTQ